MFGLEYFCFQLVLPPRLCQILKCKCVHKPPKICQFRVSTAASATPMIQTMRTRWATPSMGRRGGGRAHPSPGDWSTMRWMSPWTSVRWDDLIFLCYKLLFTCFTRGCGGRNMALIELLFGVVEWWNFFCVKLSARFQSTSTAPFTVGAASSGAVVALWIMQRACQESDPRPLSPAYMLPLWHTPVPLWHLACWNCTSNLKNSTSRNQKIQKSDSSSSGGNTKTKEVLSARVAHLAPTGALSQTIGFCLFLDGLSWPQIRHSQI